MEQPEGASTTFDAEAGVEFGFLNGSGTEQTRVPSRRSSSCRDGAPCFHISMYPGYVLRLSDT